MAELYWLKRPIAHRGLHDAANGAVENSASAFKSAIGGGYAIEADLQCAANDEPIVFHDTTLDRLTDQTGPVAARDVDELRNIPLKGSDDRILPLSDLLYLVRGYVPLVLEVKSKLDRDGTFERKITEMLSTYRGPVAVMSFDPYVVETFRRIAPDLTRGLVSARFDNPIAKQNLSWRQRFTLRHLLAATFARPQFIAYDVRALPAVAPLVARLVFGLPLLAWTVKTDDDRDRAQRYADAMIFEDFRP